MSTFFNNRARAAAAAANASSSKAAASKDVNPKLQPWVEKYRPKSLDDVAAQEHTVQVLQRTLQASNLPHMLFYGPPGTGKTSTILALAKQLYGPSLYSSRVLELNASDERGISIVREKVKDFARQQLTHPPSDKAYRDKYPCPPFKIIVLDEADSMTQDAQSALRRTMETYSKITRFCLVCNYVTRIIDPLASRCSKFRFKSLAAADASKRLNEIAKAEGVKMEAGVVDRLIAASEGDLRKAITFLQSAARLAGTGAAGTAKASGDGEEDSMDVDGGVSTQEAGDGSGVVTEKSIDEIAGTIPGHTIDELVEAIRPKGKGATYTAVARTVNDMIADGWSAGQAVSQLYNRILFDDMIPNKEKNQMTLVFSEVDKRLVDGADEHLEILDLALRISGIMSARPRGSK